MNIRHYETTVLNDYPQKDLSRLLDLPLGSFVKSFYNDLQDNQLNKLLKTEDKNKQLEIINQHQDLKKTFTLEFVESKLFDMVSEALNRFN